MMSNGWLPPASWSAQQHQQQIAHQQHMQHLQLHAATQQQVLFCLLLSPRSLWRYSFFKNQTYLLWRYSFFKNQTYVMQRNGCC